MAFMAGMCAPDVTAQPTIQRQSSLWEKPDTKETLREMFQVYGEEDGRMNADEFKSVLETRKTFQKMNETTLNEMIPTVLQYYDDFRRGTSIQEIIEARTRSIRNGTPVYISSTEPETEPETPSISLSDEQLGMRRYFQKKYFQNNTGFVVFVVIYYLVNAGLFTLSAVRYRKENYCIIIARGCGMCLNFNCAFTILPVLRYCSTWLRSTVAGRSLPIDHGIYFHKMIGIVIAVQSLVHTIAHLGNLFLIKAAEAASQVDAGATNGTTAAPTLEIWEYLFTLRSGVGWIGPGFGFLSGVILSVILIVMILCALPCVRRSGYFEVFWWSHTLYIAFWVFTILHGPLFWYFFIVPGTIFVLEKIYSLRSRFSTYGRTHITNVILLPSKVTHLIIARPEGFNFKPGDYVFLNIPQIAKYEWHPFTISSAPEATDYMWLHIIGCGHWTNKLYDFFDKYGVAVDEAPLEEVTSSGRIDIGGYVMPQRGSVVPLRYRRQSSHTLFQPRQQKDVYVEVYIGGPYGTPTRRIFNTEHAVLIATGIGVTPFASILQSIMSRYQASKHDCPSCRHIWYGDVPNAVMNLKKVDFMWITPNCKSFEWFATLMSQIAVGQATEGTFERFLETSLYVTAKSVPEREVEQLRELIGLSGSEHPTDGNAIEETSPMQLNLGRPDWDAYFQNLNASKKGKVNVFFCGGQTVAKVLRVYCEQYGFTFSKEIF